MKKWTKWLLLLAAVILAAGFSRGARAADAPSIRYDANCVHDGTVKRYYEATVSFYLYKDELDGCIISGNLPDGVYAYVNTKASRVDLKGTPTKAGTYKFKVTGEGLKAGKSSSPEFTVTIAGENIVYSVTTMGCTSCSEGGTPKTNFAAGDWVRMSTTTSAALYLDHYETSVSSVKIPTGNPGERIYGAPIGFFYMPAQNVSVYAALKEKNQGSYNHNAAAKDTGTLCGETLITTMELAIDRGLVKASYTSESVADRIQSGMLYRYKIDLDKNGTPDLEMVKTVPDCFGTGGYGQAISVLSGRNVYGSYTLTIPQNDINTSADSAVYSKVVFNMGEAPHTHSPKLVAAKDPTCTAPGGKEHYECSCGSWFWDAAGKSVISNHADAIIKPLGHKMNVVTAKAATCTADGINWHVECENCGNWYWDVYGNSLIADHSKLVTKAYGHKWSEWTVVKAATETEEGLKERHCYNNAAHKEQETIPKLEPAPTEPPTTEAPPESATTEAPTEPTTEEPPVTTEAPETTEAPTEPTTEEAPVTTEVPETTAAPTEPESTSAPTEAPTAPAPTQPAPTQPASTEAPQKEGGGNTVLWILLALMVLVAGLLGGILIGQSGKKGKQGKK